MSKRCAPTISLRHAALSVTALLLWHCGSGGGKDGANHGGGAGHAQDGGAHDAGTGGHGATASHSGTGGHTGTTHTGSGGADNMKPARDAGDVAMTLDGSTGVRDAGSDDAGAGDSNAYCLDGITDYVASGPFDFDMAQSGIVKLWIPRVPADCKVPVVHFSNGTGAACDAYAGILEHLASHGFLTACSEDPTADDGVTCLTGLQTVLAEHADVADPSRLGSIGQEIGGAGALLCVGLAEQTWGDAVIYAGHAIAPQFGSGNVPDWMTQLAHIESPVFMFNGSEDFLVSAQSVRSGYELITSEKYWYEATGALHIPIPVSWASESAVVFFRWKLLGDDVAGDYFKHMPDSDRWDLQMQSP